jgi:hypothetical protein
MQEIGGKGMGAIFSSPSTDCSTKLKLVFHLLEGQQSNTLKRLRNQVSHGPPNLTGFHQSLVPRFKTTSLGKSKYTTEAMVPAGLEPATFGS